MKVIYNNKETMNNTNDYNLLLNLPMINSAELKGVKSLSNINAYSKLQVDELIGNSRAIEIVPALPINLIENTLYYVGPDANDFYDVYLVDEVRNVIHIGTSQFGEYFAGTGIIIDDDNYISAKVDNKTLIVDDDNNLHANLDMDSVPVMVGAISSEGGEKGLVPQPTIGTQYKSLQGNGIWQSIIDLVHPIGSIYLSYSNVNPGALFPNTTWVALSSGVLWTDNSGGSTVTAAVPDIQGKISIRPQSLPLSKYNATGAFKSSTWTQETSNSLKAGYAWGGAAKGAIKWSMKAINGTYDYSTGTKISSSDSVYGKSTTVQPKSIIICAWRRTA